MNKSTLTFYTVLVCLMLAQLGKLIKAESLIRQQSLEQASFVTWSFLQTIPSMYNGSNAIWISEFPYNDEEFNDIAKGLYDFDKIQINHYPLRVLTFNDRSSVMSSATSTIYVRSRFKDHQLVVAYQTKIKNKTLVLEKKNIALFK